MMTKPKESLVFFGNEQLSSTRTATTAPVFRTLIDAGYNIEGLVVRQRPGSGRKKRSTPAVIEVATQNNIPIHYVDTKSSLLGLMSQLKSNIAVLAAFGMIIPASVIDHFRLGIVNIHPSLLPKYRGPTPIESTIRNGDKTAGVSLMQLSPGMDDGPIYSQQSIRIIDSETKSDLTNQLAQLGADMLISNLPSILNHNLKPSAQDDSRATYTPMLSTGDSSMDFNQPSEAIERHIRANADWPGSKCTLFGVEVVITQAAASKEPSNNAIGTPSIPSNKQAIIVSCKTGRLSIHNLKPVGKSEMSAKDFINGYIK